MLLTTCLIKLFFLALRGARGHVLPPLECLQYTEWAIKQCLGVHINSSGNVRIYTTFSFDLHFNLNPQVIQMSLVICVCLYLYILPHSTFAHQEWS